MKLSKQVLVLLLCFLLVRFTAQAESFGPTGQSNEQQPRRPSNSLRRSYSSSSHRSLYTRTLLLLRFSPLPPIPLRLSKRTGGC